MARSAPKGPLTGLAALPPSTSGAEGFCRLPLGSATSPKLEVMRLLGQPPTLYVLKSFPDVEEAEYLVRHRPTGNIRGVQVKCLIVPDAGYRGGIDFHGPSFAPSPLIDVVILAWREDLDGFDDNAWVIPPIDIPRLVTTDQCTFRVPLRISASAPSRFDTYRAQRTAVARLVEARVAASPRPG